jgi:hypothetical protein
LLPTLTVGILGIKQRGLLTMKLFFNMILYLLAGILIFGCSNSITGEGESDDKWNEIHQCIAGVAVDYKSGISVSNINDVEIVFNQFINYSKVKNQDIFGHGYNWKFDSASKHGLYKEVKYWKVSASWFSEEDKIWRKKEVFDVSENGEVVRLLGCI